VRAAALGAIRVVADPVIADRAAKGWRLDRRRGISPLGFALERHLSQA
jgi:hypothetical protein